MKRGLIGFCTVEESLLSAIAIAIPSLALPLSLSLKTLSLSSRIRSLVFLVGVSVLSGVGGNNKIMVFMGLMNVDRKKK